MGLSNKHRAFVDEYFLHNMNATDAYIAVYPKSSYDAARANSARLIANDNIKAEIERRLKEKRLSADEVLARLGDMARSDIAGFAKVRRIADLEKNEYQGKTHVIKKFKSKITMDALGRQVEEVELELYPADGALEKIGKHHGLFVDERRVTVTVEKELNKALDRLEQRLDADTYAAVLAALDFDEGSEAEAGAVDAAPTGTE